MNLSRYYHGLTIRLHPIGRAKITGDFCILFTCRFNSCSKNITISVGQQILRLREYLYLLRNLLAHSSTKNSIFQAVETHFWSCCSSHFRAVGTPFRKWSFLSCSDGLFRAVEAIFFGAAAAAVVWPPNPRGGQIYQAELTLMFLAVPDNTAHQIYSRQQTSDMV